MGVATGQTAQANAQDLQAVPHPHPATIPALRRNIIADQVVLILPSSSRSGCAHPTLILPSSNPHPTLILLVILPSFHPHPAAHPTCHPAHTSHPHPAPGSSKRISSAPALFKHLARPTSQQLSSNLRQQQR